MTHGSLLVWTRRLDRVPVNIRMAAIAVVVLFVALVDHSVGPEIAMGFPYSVCVVAASWIISRRGGLIIAGLCAASLLWVGATAEADAGWGVLVTNTALRSTSFALFAILTSAVRRNLEDLVDTARHDKMTGALSRQAFLDELSAARRRAVLRAAPLGVVYLDLDGLKQVNDQRGHAAGDDLIRRFVEGTRRHLRSTDLFGRLGGDEFAIVLERVDPLVIDGVVSRIKSDAKVPEVSCGVRVFDGDYPSPTEMLERADRRMYEEKRRRRAGGLRA